MKNTFKLEQRIKQLEKELAHEREVNRALRTQKEECSCCGALRQDLAEARAKIHDLSQPVSVVRPANPGELVAAVMGLKH